jgi:hypothetical protein
MVLENISMGVNFNYFFVDNKRFVGNLGDGATTDSRIDFKGLTTVDLSLKYRF